LGTATLGSPPPARSATAQERPMVDRQPDVLDAAGTGLGFGKV
jgi:hypothetical protein